MMPAFKPNPTKASTKIAVAVPGDRHPAASRSERERATAACSKREDREQAEGRGVGRDQVKPAGLADLFFVVVGRDQEEGRERHDLPAEEKQECCSWR